MFVASQQQSLACCCAADAAEPKSNTANLLKLGALFAGWYLANIYFNM
jgi:hypothetical protein